MTLTFDVDLPDDFQRFRLPVGVASRLQSLLNRQDFGETLPSPERQEAEGLVDLGDLFTLLKLRAERLQPSPKFPLG